MTRMATTPIYGKNFLNIISGTMGHWLLDLVCSMGDVGPTRFAQMNLLYDKGQIYDKVKFDS